MRLELSVKQKWFQVCGFASLGAVGIYPSIVMWPYPKLKDVFCVVATVTFSIMAVMSWLSIHNNWSKEKHERAMTISVLVLGAVIAILWVLNFIGQHAASR
jgi:cellobiose-specific phosphotransferase system component IIC